MQGTWKESISGWRKDSRRKVHSRKHTLKDKVKPLIKKFYYKRINNETLHKINDVIFIYNKPLCEDWHNQYGFWGKKSRKWYQTKANRKDRRLIKEYCKFGDFDGSLVKTHCTSKSIAWAVW